MPSDNRRSHPSGKCLPWLTTSEQAHSDFVDQRYNELLSQRADSIEMSSQVKRMTATIFVLLLSLTQVTAVLARSYESIQRDIEARLAESKKLAGTRIEVHMDDGLVVLAGSVRLYEQKLAVERIAWTTPGVVEVDNEIRVIPRVPLSDRAIERKIQVIIKGNEQLRASGIEVQVSEGRVFLRGSFVNFSDPSRLKHKVAEIEGVVSIDMDAVFLA